MNLDKPKPAILVAVAFSVFFQSGSTLTGQENGVTTLGSKSLKENTKIALTKNWSFHAGDNDDWANPEFDDSAWERVDTRLAPNQLPQGGWSGIGWFRLHLSVDSMCQRNHSG